MSRLIPLITMNILLLSLFAIAQEQENFNQNDGSTWNDKNLDQVYWPGVTKQTLNQADPKLLESKVTAEQAKQYFTGRYPITADSQNELILYRKIYPNVDVESFKNVDRVKLGEGVIQTPTGTVDFGNSDVKVTFDKQKGLMVGDLQVSGNIKVYSKDHFTLGPRSSVKTPDQVLFLVSGTTEFYTVGNSCTGTTSCIESDIQNKYLRGIAKDGNVITIKANNDFSMYDKIQLFKDVNSKLWLWEGKGGNIYGPQLIFREGADTPVSTGILPFRTDVEIGQIGSKTLSLSKDGGMIKEGTTFGKAFAGGALNKILRENIGVYITPDTNVIESYRTSDDFDVYRTTGKEVKKEIFIMDSQNKQLGAIYYADGELFRLQQGRATLGPDGIPILNPDGSIKMEPIQQKLDINKLGPQSRKTLDEAISGRPSNVVPDKDIPTLNQPGIRTRCPQNVPGIRLRC